MKKERNLIGKIFKYLFIGFNLLMIYWIGSYWCDVASIAGNDEYSQAGAAIGGTIGTGVIVFFWMAGDVILGLFVLLTKPK